MLKLLKDYGVTILHNPEKINMVADALSKKSMENLAMLNTSQMPLQEEIRQLELEVVASSTLMKLRTLCLQLNLLERIKEKQASYK